MRRIGMHYLKHPKVAAAGVFVFGGRHTKKDLLAGGVDDIRGVPRFCDCHGKALRKVKTLLEVSEQAGTFYFHTKSRSLYVHPLNNEPLSEYSVIA